jgi:DNA-binding MarR family transcriptional regulator
MAASPLDTGLGTQLRQLNELMEGAVAEIDAALGLADYRPRYSPVVRTLVKLGPSSIRELANDIATTHSAISQTVAQMQRRGLVRLEQGVDARQRIVHLTETAIALLPIIEAEWQATNAAVVAMDAELPCPLSDMVAALAQALQRQSFRQRIVAAAQTLDDPKVAAVRALFAGGGQERAGGNEA